jgi:hypothetical protein
LRKAFASVVIDLVEDVLQDVEDQKTTLFLENQIVGVFVFLFFLFFISQAAISVFN